MSGSIFVSAENLKTKEAELAFIKGDIKAKCAAVEKCAAYGDYSLNLKAFDFLIENRAVLETDDDAVQLLKTSVETLNENSNSEEISNRLCDIFKYFNSDEVKILTLNKLAFFSSSNSVSLINSYISEMIGKNVPLSDVGRSAIKSLKGNGNNTTFRLIFIADVLNVWPQDRELLSEVWGPLANDCEKEIIHVFSTVDMERKLDMIYLLKKNPDVSRKILGEIAENALSLATYNIEDSSVIPSYQIKMQLEAVKIIAESQWTRSAKQVTDFFSIVRSEYEHGYISDEDFAMAIADIAKVASSETSVVLSQYLDFLNKKMENREPPVQTVILAVINALGGLGDKTAFDYLLYVTYLDYPEEVIAAAKNALSKLKW